MTYLVDTNIFLEILLDQKQRQVAQEFLSTGTLNQLSITDFSLHSIGVILFQRNQQDQYEEFLADMVWSAGVRIKSLNRFQLQKIFHPAKQYNLDFDDAYQYVAVKEHHLELVSFDADFDRTDLKRKLPGDLL